MQSNRMERLTVGAIENKLMESEKALVPHITKGDKEPSFDGHIEVYSSDEETVGNYLKKIPIQVKGRTVDNLSTKTTTMSLKIEHFVNYYREGGVIFFVVEVLRKKNVTRIFYKQLLPLELKQIIDRTKKKGKKSTSFSLRDLEMDNLYGVFYKFIDEQKLQGTMDIEEPIKKHYEVYQFRSLTVNPYRDTFQDMIGQEIIAYGVENQRLYPLQHGVIGQVVVTKKSIIKLDQNEYELNIELITTEKEDVRHAIIEDVLEIIIDNSDSGKNKLKYKLLKFYSLEKQLMIFSFLVDMMQAESIDFSLAEVSLKVNEKHINETKNRLEKVQSFIQFFKDFGLDSNTYIQDDTNIEKDIEVLKQHYYGEIDEIGTAQNFINFPFGEKNVLVFTFIDPKTKEREFYNAFSEKMLQINAYWQVEQTTIYLSPFIILSTDTLASCINLDIYLIISTFENGMYDSAENFNHINEFCLRCINAYDRTKNKELIRLVEKLLENFDQKFINISKDQKDVSDINFLQTKLRLYKELDREDNKLLMELKRTFISEKHHMGEFCTSVLLGSKREADLKIDEAREDIRKANEESPSTEQATNIEDYPIYTLYEELE